MTENNGSANAGNPAAAGGDNNANANNGGGDQPWYGSVEDADLRGFAELKGWKDPGAALRSYRDLEKFQGLPPERLAKVPEADDAAGWSEFNKRFGWAPPEKADDYGLNTLEGFDASFANAAQGVFHKHNLPKDRVVAAMKDIGEVLGKMQTDAETLRNTTHNNELTALKTEWGPNFDGLVETGKRAIAEYMPKTGLADADMDAIRDVIGTAKFNKLWAGIGSTMGEAAFHDGNSNSGQGANVLTPEAVNTRINALMQDKEWFARKEAGGVKENTEWARLTKLQAEYSAAQHQRTF